MRRLRRAQASSAPQIGWLGVQTLEGYIVRCNGLEREVSLNGGEFTRQGLLDVVLRAAGGKKHQAKFANEIKTPTTRKRLPLK